MKFAMISQGWCTPTVTVLALGFLVCLMLLIQLIVHRDSKQSRRDLAWSLLAHALFFLVTGGVMFFLCSRGKVTASWIIFGFVYILPLVFLLGILMARAYKRTKCVVQ